MTKADKAEYNRAYHKATYAKNRERKLALVKKYASENKEKVQDRQRCYRQKNAEQLRAVSKAYYEAHRAERIAYQKALNATRPDAVRSYKKQWWESNRDEHRAKKRSHYYKNRDAVSAKQRQSYAVNPHPFKEHSARRRAAKRATAVERVDLKAILRESNGVCGICKKPLDLFGIDFDHIVPLSKGGTHTTENIQATHSYCNRSKGARVG